MVVKWHRTLLDWYPSIPLIKFYPEGHHLQGGKKNKTEPCNHKYIAKFLMALIHERPRFKSPIWQIILRNNKAFSWPLFKICGLLHGMILLKVLSCHNLKENKGLFQLGLPVVLTINQKISTNNYFLPPPNICFASTKINIKLVPKQPKYECDYHTHTQKSFIWGKTKSIMYKHHTQPIYLKKEALQRRFHIQTLPDKYF